MVPGVNAVGVALTIAFVAWLAWTLASLQRQLSRMKRDLGRSKPRMNELPPDGLIREDVATVLAGSDLPIREDRLAKIDFSGALADGLSKKER